MQQIPSVLSSREAARIVDVDATTIQRAIASGDLPAARHRDRAPWRIQRSDLLTWAGANGYAAVNGNGERIDAATGEVLEHAQAYESAQLGPVTVVNGEVTPTSRAATVADARARLAGVKVTGDGPFDSDIRLEANVARLLLPSAESGLLEAARRLVALPESPELWQALRAVLGVGA